LFSWIGFKCSLVVKRNYDSHLASKGKYVFYR